VERIEDFVRFVGSKAKLKLVEGHPRRRYTGLLAGVDGQDVLIQVDGTEHRIFLDTIERAHLVLSLEEYEELSGSGVEQPDSDEPGGTDDLK
jgi:ribosome maturation factor RimP